MPLIPYPLLALIVKVDPMTNRALSRRLFLKTSAGGIAIGACSFGRLARSQTAEPSLIESARLIGKQFQNGPVKVSGLDGATSLLLPSGESLWVFGDTMEVPFESMKGVDLKDKLSNTAAIVPAQDASQGIQQFHFLTQSGGSRPRQIIPYADGEDPATQRLWPMHGTCVGKHVYLFYHRISLINGVDVFDSFQLEGMGIARANIDDLQFERLIAPDGTREFWKGNDPTFGVFVDRSDDYVYLWGSLMTGMFLARTRPDSIENLASYEYLVAAPTLSNSAVEPRWSTKFEPTACMFDSVPNEMSASFNKHLAKYTAIHSFLRENKIVLRTAARIEGPWSEGQVVYRPERVKDTDLIYAAKQHPELARKDGKTIYITFVNSSTYLPELIELALKS
jgi:hypothetical protein